MSNAWRIGVCSWSLEPENADALTERAVATGATSVQLALDPIRTGVMGVAEVRDRLRDAGLALASGMMAMQDEDYSSIASIRATGGVAPDRTWPVNRKAARDLAKIAGEFKLGLVSFHAGFLPEEGADGRWKIMIARLRELAAIYADRGVRVALETGQERPATLLRAMELLREDRVGVNFDPGNCILYGYSNPTNALELLAPHVVQVHIKDAKPSTVAEEWGQEVPVGDGSVDWGAILNGLRHCGGLTGLMVEREAGTNRVEDIARATRFLQSALS